MHKENQYKGTHVGQGPWRCSLASLAPHSPQLPTCISPGRVPSSLRFLGDNQADFLTTAANISRHHLHCKAQARSDLPSRASLSLSTAESAKIHLRILPVPPSPPPPAPRGIIASTPHLFLLPDTQTGLWQTLSSAQIPAFKTSYYESKSLQRV